MAELDNKKKETTDKSQENKAAEDVVQQRIKCTCCGHTHSSTTLKCPICGTIHWANLPGYIKENQKAQIFIGGVATSIVVLFGIGMWGLTRTNQVEALMSASTSSNTAISSDASVGGVSAVTVKFGAENYTMPDVRGLSESDARSALECMGLKVIINTVCVSGVSDGCVAEQSITPYQAVNKGDIIYLSVSKGAETKAGTVPDLTGVSYEEAVEIAADNSVALVVKEKVFDSIDSETKVMTQDVGAGTEIGDNQAIGVVVALCDHEFMMPDLVDMDEQSAQQLMRNLGADVSIDYEENLEATNGMVFSQSIEKDEMIVPSMSVRLKVTQNDEIVIPEVVGMTQNEAVAMLRGKGLTVEIEYDHSSTQEKDCVISQSIPGNSIITVGSGDKKIILVISDSEETEILVEVPNAVGKDVDSARDLLENRGFRVKLTQEESSKTVGTVLWQSLEAGEKQAYGSLITLAVSKGKKSSKSSSALSSTSASSSISASSSTSTPASSSASTTQSTASSVTSKPDLTGIPPESSTDPRDKAIRTLMLGGITREQIDSGAYDDIIAIYMQGYGN